MNRVYAAAARAEKSNDPYWACIARASVVGMRRRITQRLRRLTFLVRQDAPSVIVAQERRMLRQEIDALMLKQEGRALNADPDPTAARRVGEALCRLHAAKARGWEWSAYSSHCGGGFSNLVIVQLWRPGSALPQPLVGALEDVLERAVEVAEAAAPRSRDDA